MLTDDDILALVDRRESVEDGLSDDERESDDEPEIAHHPPPTSLQATEAIQVLQTFFEAGKREDGILALVGIEKIVQQVSKQNMVQSSLLSFFQRK